MKLEPIYYTFRNFYIPKPKISYTYDNVIEHAYHIVYDIFEISKEQIKSKTRKREVVNARRVVAYLGYKYTNWTLAKIGLELGGRDHSTVIHARESLNDLILYDKVYQKQLEKCERYMCSMFREVIRDEEEFYKFSKSRV